MCTWGPAGVVVLKFLRLPSGTSSMQLNLIGDAGGARRHSDEAATDDSGSEATDNEMLLHGNTYANAENFMTREDEEQVERSGVRISLGQVSVSSTMPVSQLIRIPLLKEVATIYFFVNLLRFAIYMWLPIFLHTVVGYDKVTCRTNLLFSFGTSAACALNELIVATTILAPQQNDAGWISMFFETGALLGVPGERV